MAKGDDIQERLIAFAVAIIKFCSSLPKTPEGKHIAGQLLRCGTSPAPNYGEARGGESTRDFIHKLGVVLKELNESGIWLEIIKRAGLLDLNVVEPLSDECTELCKIISSSIQTTSDRQTKL